MDAAVTLSQGHVIRGRGSKAKAFVEADVVGGQMFNVYQVYGNFRAGEVIERDGVEIGTLNDMFSFEITDAKGITGRDPTQTLLHLLVTLSWIVRHLSLVVTSTSAAAVLLVH